VNSIATPGADRTGLRVRFLLPGLADAVSGSAGRMLAGLLLLFAVMTPVGVAMMLTPALAERFLWTTTIYLFVESAALFLLIRQLSGWGRASVSAVVIVCGALAVEYIGVQTGYPFGAYVYSPMLQPLIGGAVPLAIGFAWYSVMIAVYLLVVNLAEPKMPAVLIVLLTASGVLAFDLMLEPFAAYVNGFWTWSDGAVPVWNYLSWFGLGLVFATILVRALPRDAMRRPGARTVAAGILLLTVAQFVVVNLFHLHGAPVAASMAAFIALYAVLRTRRHAH
jgi:uncharacterized membrane protein